MPRYKYEGRFKCDKCGKESLKKGTCRPKECPYCGANKSAIKLIGKKELQPEADQPSAGSNNN